MISCTCRLLKKMLLTQAAQLISVAFQCIKIWNLFVCVNVGGYKRKSYQTFIKLKQSHECTCYTISDFLYRLILISWDKQKYGLKYSVFIQSRIFYQINQTA